MMVSLYRMRFFDFPTPTRNRLQKEPRRWRLWIWFLVLLGIATASTAMEPDAEAVSRNAEYLLMRQDFDGLEDQAAEFRNPDLRVKGGNWKLYYFYGGLASYQGITTFGWPSQVGFEQKQEALSRWIEALPDSTAARIATIQFWLRYAWDSRGEAFAKDVQPHQWREFERGLAEARRLTGRGLRTEGGPRRDPVLAQDDPHAYHVLINLAKGLGERARIDRLFAKAIEAHPDYPHYFSQRAGILLPKWYGKDGELRQFVRSVLETPGGEDGLMGYSYLAHVLDRNLGGPEFFNQTGLTWPAVKRAYSLREERYGLRNRDWNALLSLAVDGRDIETATHALERIGDDWSPVVWSSEKSFRRTADWVRHQAGETN